MYLIIKVAGILPKYSHFCSLLLGWDLFRFANFLKNENLSPLSNLYIRYICIIIIIILNCDMMFCYAVNWNNIPQDIQNLIWEKVWPFYYEEQYFILILDVLFDNPPRSTILETWQLLDFRNKNIKQSFIWKNCSKKLFFYWISPEIFHKIFYF